MEKKENTHPWLVISLLWGVVLFFTLYGAKAVYDEFKQPSLEAITSLVAKAGDAIGMIHIRDGVEAIRGRLNKDYVVLATETVETSPPIAETASGVRAGQPSAEEASHWAAPRKRRVLVVGASSIQFALGVELEHQLPAKYEGVKTKRFGKLATGLSRPDFFDWPKKIEELAKRFKPDLMIANYGGNCGQDIPVGDRLVKYDDAAAWDPLYAARVKEIVEIAKKHGSDFVFLGMPNMRDPKFAKKMKRVNRVQRQAAEEAGALWISVWEMTSTPAGKYRTEIEFEEERGLMRAIDGVHYRTLGARYLIEETMQEVERHFIFTPVDALLARSERHSFRSKKLGQTISYVAFIPRIASDQNRLPSLYLVPGHVSKWNEWPNYPHRELQRLANEHRLVLVVLELDRLAPKLLAEEIAPDVAAHLPVSERHAVESFEQIDVETLRRALPDLVSRHAEQLTTPMTRR